MKYFSGAVVMLLLFAGCKKNNAEEVSPAPPTTAVCGNSASIVACNSSTYHCMLLLKKGAEVNGASLINSFSMADATFSNSLSGYTSSVTSVAVDTVKVNGVPMFFDSFDISYIDTTFLSGGQVAYPATWEVDGNNGIPSFTFTEGAGFPDYTGYALMPDTIHPSQGFSFAISGISNAGSIMILLQQASQTSFKSLPGNSTSVTFSAADLANFTAGNTTLNVIVLKDNVQSVYGKIMNFATSFSVSKSIIAQ